MSSKFKIHPIDKRGEREKQYDKMEYDQMKSMQLELQKIKIKLKSRESELSNLKNQNKENQQQILFVMNMRNRLNPEDRKSKLTYYPGPRKILSYTIQNQSEITQKQKLTFSIFEMMNRLDRNDKF